MQSPGITPMVSVDSIKDGVEMAMPWLLVVRPLKTQTITGVSRWVRSFCQIRILVKKAREVETMEREELSPASKLSLSWIFENQQDRLQNCTRSRRRVQAWVISSDMDIVQQAQTYEANGAAVMISVPTDEVSLQRSFDYLREISSQADSGHWTRILPSMSKLSGARNGCDGLVLIVAAFIRRTPRELYDLCDRAWIRSVSGNS